MPRTGASAEDSEKPNAGWIGKQRTKSIVIQSRIALLSDTTLLVPFLRQRLASFMASATTSGDALGPGARQAAVLVPLYAVERRPYLLFTQRTTTLRSHAGQISFPGGRRDPEDTSAVATALREAHEELALSPSSIAVLGELPAAFTSASNHLVQPVVGWLAQGLPELHPNPAEVAEVIEAPLAALADPAIYHEEVWTRGGAAHTVHFYDLGAHRIWGLTAFLLHTLLELLPAD